MSSHVFVCCHGSITDVFIFVYLALKFIIVRNVCVNFGMLKEYSWFKEMASNFFCVMFELICLLLQLASFFSLSCPHAMQITLLSLLERLA